jgi:hypothetical protein
MLTTRCSDDHYFEHFIRLSLLVPTIDVDTNDGCQSSLVQLVASLNAER